MSNPTRLRSRAAHRAAVLRTRANMMSLVAAMTQFDLDALRHGAALAERRGRDIETQQRIDDLLRQEIRTRADLMEVSGTTHLSAGALDRIEHLEKDLALLGELLIQARRERAFALEAVNDRIAAMAIAKEKSATQLADAMAIAGVRATALIDLVALTGVPEADEILIASTAPTRAARAATLLEAMSAESRRAAEELSRVGSSAAYDEALTEQIDAEEAYAEARRRAAVAVEREREAFRALSAAQRQLSEAERSGGAAKAGPGGASSVMGKGSDRPAAAAEPAQSSRECTSRGAWSGERESASADRPIGASRSETDSEPGAQQPSREPQREAGSAIALGNAAASGISVSIDHNDARRQLTVTAPAVRS